MHFPHHPRDGGTGFAGLYGHHFHRTMQFPCLSSPVGMNRIPDTTSTRAGGHFCDLSKGGPRNARDEASEGFHNQPQGFQAEIANCVTPHVYSSFHIRCDAASMALGGVIVGFCGIKGWSCPGIPPLTMICP